MADKIPILVQRLHFKERERHHAYADSIDDIKKLWPEAHEIEAEEVNEIVFTSRFPKPDWYKEGRK